MAQNYILGVTGSREVRYGAQVQQVALLLKEWQVTELHHGDCVGADAEVHREARRTKQNPRIIIHPPLHAGWRAYCVGDLILPKKEYIARNHDIVASSDAMIALPKSEVEERRSGTWATVRYAREHGVPVLIILPDGKMKWY